LNLLQCVRGLTNLPETEGRLKRYRSDAGLTPDEFCNIHMEDSFTANRRGSRPIHTRRHCCEKHQERQFNGKRVQFRRSRAETKRSNGQTSRRRRRDRGIEEEVEGRSLKLEDQRGEMAWYADTLLKLWADVCVSKDRVDAVRIALAASVRPPQVQIFSPRFRDFKKARDQSAMHRRAVRDSV
jgi:hypothetical protein